MTPQIRPARAGDADAMCALLNAIIAKGGTTAYRRPFTPERMRADYIDAPRLIRCSVALLADRLVGFQALKRPDSDGAGGDPLPPDWGYIASFVAEGMQGHGIGRALFAATLEAARAARIPTIDATIRRENAIGLSYYARMGFRDWRDSAASISKRFDLDEISET